MPSIKKSGPKAKLVWMGGAILVVSLGLAWANESFGRMPVGDLPGWKQTHTQDFSTPAAKGKVGAVYGPEMRGYAGFSDTSGIGTYSPDSVLSVANGKLDYFLHVQDGTPHVASVIPFGYAGQTYGRYSIRFRADSLPDYKIAFMLWPVSDEWNEGEIDFPEGTLDRPLYASSAVKGSLGKSGMRFDPPQKVYASDAATGWHVATTEWTPGKVRWFWDDQLIGETGVPSGVPDTDLRWTLQAETRDAAKDAANTSASGHIEIDWVVQYAYAP
ncbi:glycoside hydrolase family 16 protein [Arthrobacter sp. VKM Ac-2550]|uniref:glycoside hydrolase family 16 protein n=1 Tax=Crystallibacter permensis TaxID=1938888 RepID=UPI00222650EE|nr:glycoside hydrolase family 16 protein [Arthrobacter sp. VKM Ac-2550]MCW2131639.1 Glycosyl hydrolases family 16 [Arthrobacter sp. VKM Ac-2550]